MVVQQIKTKKNKNMKKAIVISGGGCKGAWAFGWLSYHTDKKPFLHKEYDYYVGTSAGALVACAFAAGKIKDASELFISLDNDKVYKRCPFKIREKLGIGKYRTSMKLFPMVGSVLLNTYDTFGDSTPVLSLIRKIYTESDHQNIKDSERKLIITVTNINNKNSVYIDASKYDYETFTKYVFASTAAAPIMSVVEIDGVQYVDGGILESTPITGIIGYNDIQSIDVLNLNQGYSEISRINNPIDIISSYIDMFMNQGNSDDIIVGALKASQTGKDLKIYEPSKFLTDSPFVFVPEDMKWFYEYGRQDAAKGYKRSNYQFLADRNKSVVKIV